MIKFIRVAGAIFIFIIILLFSANFENTSDYAWAMIFGVLAYILLWVFTMLFEDEYKMKY